MIELVDLNDFPGGFIQIENELKMWNDFFVDIIRDENQIVFLPIVIDVKGFALEESLRREIGIRGMKIIDEECRDHR